MSDSSPWDEIKTPRADYNVRQVAAPTSASCFWGRDIAGCYLLILELEGDHSAQFRKNLAVVKGIQVDLRQGNTGGVQNLVLTLEQHVNRDLFEGLCRTLILALAHATDSSTSLAIALAHIQRWKTFLAGRGGPQLSPDEVRGLYGEIMFLLELLDHMPSTAKAIEAWLGPERSHQDFIFGNTAIEIKSISGVERNSVRISSEDQLESLNDALYLRIYRLNALPDAAQALSLNELVIRIQEQLTDASAVESFDRKLVAQGYVPLPEYDEPRFVVSEFKSYRVLDEFPRLARSTLPDGVMKTNYEIKLESIAQFECGNGDIFQEK